MQLPHEYLRERVANQQIKDVEELLSLHLTPWPLATVIIRLFGMHTVEATVCNLSFREAHRRIYTR